LFLIIQNALNIETISLTEKKNLQNPLGHGNKSSPSIGLTNATATAVGELVNEIENIDYSKLSLLDRLVAKKTRLVFPPNLSEYPSCRMNLLKKKMKIENWKPKGLCIFSLSEHTKCVNQVLVSMDSLFFASCSDDGTVKIWDCNRLEKNVANRSRSTYAKDKPIKCMCFIYATHAIACGYGACIDIFKVAYISNNARYGKNSLIQQIHVPSGSRVTAIIHFNRDVLSILSFSTHTGEIYGYELRTNSQVQWRIIILVVEY
jgi:phosphoinositide-3-kinase regulatory subunit 4